MDNLAEQETGTDQERRLAALRTELEKEGVDGFLITTADEYQGEYPPASARRLAWLSGFTGSAGALAVLPDEAAIFVDGRYTVQARQQVDAGDYQQCGLSPGYASVAEWLKDNAKPGSKIAYDPWLHTQNFIETMDRALKGKGVDLVAIANNPIDALWHDRPAIPQAPVQVHPAERAGEESASKRKRVGKSVADKGCDAVMITAPDSIAWLLNIRGGDVSHTPLALSYAMLHADGKVDWFIDEAKLSDNVRKHVGADVRIHSPEEMEQALVALGRDKKTVLYDAVRSAAWFHQQLEEAGATIKRGDDPCLLPKACKNPVEIEGMRQAHIRDGVALAKLLCWLDQEAPKGHVMELDVEDKLLAFRQEQADFQEPSFATIAGSGEHGAIVHYKASEKSNKSLENNSLFLLDSGGQYLDGTTDVTRTIVVGTPTDEQKRRFTQVLKGHIALATAVFPQGTTGKEIDVLARKALWADGQDYAHGTGHGVGAYLGVHEGPAGISKTAEVPFAPGMVLSNEPGFYKEGEYGIRTENLVVVEEKKGLADDGKAYYGFETITLSPIDTRLIDTSLLERSEVEWLNAYHERVRETLSPHLPQAERVWLEAKTEPLQVKQRAGTTGRAV